MPEDGVGALDPRSAGFVAEWQALLTTWKTQLDGLVADVSVTEGMPASVTALDEVEARLGVALPPSLRAFYAVTDGLANTGTPYGVTGLRKATDLGWFRDVEAGWFEAWVGGARTGYDDENELEAMFEVRLMRRALLWSVGETAVLFDPEDIDPVTGEWRVWMFESEIGAHASSATALEAGRRLYRNFLAANALTEPVDAKEQHPVEAAYRQLLSGDRSAEKVMAGYRESFGWRAWLLSAQVEAFARRSEPNWTGHPFRFVWQEDASMAGLDFDVVLSDWAIVNDCIPLAVIAAHQRTLRDAPNILRQTISQGYRTPMDEVEFEQECRHLVEQHFEMQVRMLPDVIGERMRTLRDDYDRNGGLAADFSYSPSFAVAIEQVRALMRDVPQGDELIPRPTFAIPREDWGNQEKMRLARDAAWAAMPTPTGPLYDAWDLLVTALSDWEPATTNHLGPLGLLWDADISRLVLDSACRAALQMSGRTDLGTMVLATPRAPRYRHS